MLYKNNIIKKIIFFLEIYQNPINSNIKTDVECQKNLSTENKKKKIDKRKKITDTDYIKELFSFVRNSTYWSRCTGPIKGNTLHKKHLKFVSSSFYEKLYENSLKLYLGTDYYNSQKYQIIDSSFIPNKQGSELIGRNANYNNKNGIKILSVTEQYGVPLYITLVLKMIMNMIQPLC